MKMSEEYKWYAREALGFGVLITILLFVAFGFSVASGVVGIFVGILGILPGLFFVSVLLFIEYRNDKNMQKDLEREECKEYFEKQKCPANEA